MLVCPRTRQALRPVPVEAARHVITGGPPLVAAPRPDGPPPVGETPTVLLRSDDAVAFPVVDDIPVLMWPEALGPGTGRDPVDLADARYAEAYAEMGYYGGVADEALADVADTGTYAMVAALQADLRAAPRREAFPRPARVWLDAAYDCTAQERVYLHVGPNVNGGSVAQLGGSGVHALKLLVAGARSAVLVTPVLSEARLAGAVAGRLGLGDGFRAVVGIGEEPPLASGTLDVAVSGGSLHHMLPAAAGAEVRRALRPGGRFGAWDPWRAPLYGVGTAVLGKRDPDVACRPLDEARATAFLDAFGEGADLRRHGALTRYPMLALGKAGVSLGVRVALPVLRADDRLARGRLWLERLQSSVSICGLRPEA